VAVLDGVDAAEAQRVVALLAQADITASQAPSTRAIGSRVGVEAESVARAVEVLRADGSTPQGSAPPTGGAVLEGLATERARLDAALGASIAQTLRGVEGVTGARVHLAEEGLPRLDEPVDMAPRRASVALRLRADAAVDTAAVQHLVAHAVRGLSPDHVALHITHEPTLLPRPRLLHVGPFAVAPTSAEPLRRTLTLLLASNVALALLGLVFGWRRRRPAPTPARGPRQG